MSYNSPYDRAHKGSIKIYRKIQNKFERLEREEYINKYTVLILEQLVKINEDIPDKYWYECITNTEELMRFAMRYLPIANTKEQRSDLSIFFEQIKKILVFNTN